MVFAVSREDLSDSVLVRIDDPSPSYSLSVRIKAG